VFKDSGGIARGIFASVRDVTDRVRLEEQMREQQAYLRGLIESSGDGLVTVDPEGFITDLNEQMCRMTGYSRQELMGSVFKRYFTQPDNAELGVRRTLAEGGVTNYGAGARVKGRPEGSLLIQRLGVPGPGRPHRGHLRVHAGTSPKKLAWKPS